NELREYPMTCGFQDTQCPAGWHVVVPGGGPGSPTYANGLVYVASAQALTAYDVYGDVAWDTPLNGTIGGDRRPVVVDGAVLATGALAAVAFLAPANATPGTHTVTARAGTAGDQKPFLVRTSWTQDGFGPAHTGLNSFENVLTAGTVGDLDLIGAFQSKARLG